VFALIKIFVLLFAFFREISMSRHARVLSVRLSSPDRHPKTSGFDVAEGRI
jgi:hypothetical protein